MGKVEKYIVLSVLLVIVGILVVSLTVDDPLNKDKVAFAGETSPRSPDVSAPGATPPISPIGPSDAADTSPSKPAGAAPSTTLSMSVTPPATESKPAMMAIPQGAILKTTEGLQDSFMPDMKFYTWQAGDTFPILAQRFYGDASRLATLRRVNEGRFDVQPGERVLIPIYDLDGAIPTYGVPPAVAGAAPAKAAITTPAPAKADASGTPRVHLVKEGESLWKIAKQELGAGSRWKEIYDANRDVLTSPEALHTGIKLRIP